MSKRRSTRVGVPSLLGCLVLALLQARTAAAATGVLAWEQIFRQDLTGSGVQQSLAARELADGTRMVVVYDNFFAFSAVRYDAAGTLLTTASFNPSYTTTLDAFVDFDGFPTAAAVAIDAFGGVFIGAISGLSSAPFYTRGDTWIMKYDGLTGRAAWTSPAAFTLPDGRLAAPRALLVDDHGDLVVSVVAKPGGGVRDQVLLKYAGSTGVPLWGPAILPSVLSSAAALDGAGSVLVTAGTSAGDSTAISAVKYSGTTGAPLWGPVLVDQVGYEMPGAIAVDLGGDVFIAAEFASGVAHAYEVVKLDGQSGALQWGPSLWTPPGPSYSASPTALAASPSGDVFVSGHVSGSAGPFRATLAFSGDSGSLLWGPEMETVNQVFPLSLTAAGSGDVIVSAYATLSPSGFQLRTTRLGGRDGVVVWGPEALDVSHNFSTPPIAFLAASGDLFTAETAAAETSTDAIVFERDGATGAVTWGPVAFTGAASGSSRLHDLTVGPDGNVIVTGFVRTATGSLSWATLKYDEATGSPLWGPVLFDSGSPGGLNPYQVVTDAAGNAFVAGYAETGNEVRLAVLKYAAGTGATLWTSGIISNFLPRGLSIDGAGNAIVLGRVFSDTGYDAAVVKLSGTTGQAIWGPVLYDVGPEDDVASLVVDAAGDLILTGSAYEPFVGTQDWFTLKASSATGAVLWGPVLVEGVYQTPTRAALDPTGNVVVVGTSQNQMMTIKYSGASGAVLWGPVFYDSPANFARGIWIAIDGAGDVFASGISWSLEDDVYNGDYVTIKYRGSDGATLWGPVLFNGPGDGLDLVYAVELDAGGNPVVSGDTEMTADGYRIATLKYDGANGNVIWGPVLSWPSGPNDLNGLAVRGNRVFLGGVAENAYRTTVLTESLGIATAAEEIPVAVCGSALGVSLAAENGTPGYSWSIVSGALPPGVALASDGHLSGSPSEEGAFLFRAQVQDSVGATAARDFTLVVGGGAALPILASADGSCHVTLSVAGSWAGFQWLPGGETTPSILVSPFEATTYGVLLTDGSGCLRRGSVTVPATALTDSDCLAPSLASVSPSWGAAAGGTTVTITGSKFQAGAQVRIGGLSAGSVSVSSPTELTAATPALAPGAVYDMVLQNPDSGSALLPDAWTTDFLDIPPSDPFHDAVLSVLRHGITAGCGGGNFCRNSNITRAQMAVFLLKASLGSGYAPPSATGIFSDVWVGSFAADWIEDLYNRGITGGCGSNPLRYCPDHAVTRAQMSVFLLKTEHGSTYAPPACAGVFADVPCTPSPAFAVDWIEQLYAEQVTGGCAASPLRYCPAAPVTRGQMAVFLVRTFQLP